MEHFAWPICVCAVLLILGFTFLILHNKEIGRLIDRTRSIGKEGVQADAASALATTRQEEAKETTPNTSAVDELLKTFDNQLLVEQEAYITKLLNDGGVKKPEDREQVLTRYLAWCYIVIRFESLFQSIFCSQLNALALLNSTAPDGLPFAALEPWYEVGKTAYPAIYTSYTFDQWLGYMTRMVLIRSAEGDATRVQITVLGREFLKYLVESGYSYSDKIG
jgi:hypothetical protein